MLPTRERSEVTKTTFINRYHAKRTFDLTVQTRSWLCWGAGQRGKQEVANSSSTGTRRLRPAGTASASEGGGSWTRGRMSEHGRFGLQQSDQLTKIRFRHRFVSMESFIFIFNFTVSFFQKHHIVIEGLIEHSRI